jgi:hypothetical protein
MDEIDFVEHLKVLSLVPNDIIVIKTDRVLSEVQYANVKRYIGQIINRADVKIMILEDGMDIGIFRGGVIDESSV